MIYKLNSMPVVSYKKQKKTIKNNENNKEYFYLVFKFDQELN